MWAALSHGKGATANRVKWQEGRIFVLIAACLALFLVQAAYTQTISPILVEYTEKGGGRFDLTNNTLSPMAIVLEPRSFDIGLDGSATYRPLDAGIHLELSTMSFRLEPKQTYYVFYKAHADTLPAWFTVYAVFSPIDTGEGLKLRLMLPHTVYLYQKNPIDKQAIRIQNAVYLSGRKTVACDLENSSQSLVRVQEVRAIGGKEPVVSGGFPLLPGNTRHLEIPWSQISPPSSLLLRFPHFDVKEPLSITDQ